MRVTSLLPSLGLTLPFLDASSSKEAALTIKAINVLASYSDHLIRELYNRDNKNPAPMFNIKFSGVVGEFTNDILVVWHNMAYSAQLM